MGDEAGVCRGVFAVLLGKKTHIRNNSANFIVHGGKLPIPSACFTCTSFQNLFSFAVPPPVPPATALRSCPLFNSSACFLRLATLDSTNSALGIGALGGGPVVVSLPITVAGCGGVVCRHLDANAVVVRDLDGLRIAKGPFPAGN